MNLDETLHALKAAGTKQNRTVYRQHGVTSEMFGVSFRTWTRVAKSFRTVPPGNIPARFLARAELCWHGSLFFVLQRNCQSIRYFDEGCRLLRKNREMFLRVQQTRPPGTSSDDLCGMETACPYWRILMPKLPVIFPGEARFLAFLLFSIASLILPRAVFPTTVEKFTLEDLVHKSGRIVLGKCLSTESRWNDRNTLILTTSRFAVSEPLKGSSDGFVSVITVGGTLDGITQTVSGMPEFRTDEEVLLFLEPSRSGNWQPLGMSQGKFRILKNRLTGESEVIHSLSGLELYDSATRTLSQQDKPARMQLKPLVERIRNLLEAAR